MKLVTWNINGMRARLEVILRWLEDRKPDVVGLQELKLPDEKFPHAELEAAGYGAVHYGQKSWNGVAILYRKDVFAVPPNVQERGLPGQEDFGSRLISAEIAGLTFITVYCPNGKNLDHEDFPGKLAWFDALSQYIEKHHKPEEPVVLCGDFNICPTPLDSWDEKKHAGAIFHTDAERQRIQALLDWGFADSFRALHPEDQEFSWWDYRGGAFHRRHGLRIDFVLATAPLMKHLKAAEIDREYRKKQEGLTASDHAPVFMELDWPSP